jgi:ApeA N-terminal domain 1
MKRRATVPQFKGQFWLSTDPNTKVSGTITLSNGWPELRLEGALVTMWEDEDIVGPDGSTFRRAVLRSRKEQSALTIHGAVEKFGCVSVLDAVMIRQQITIMGHPDTGHQVFRGRYALTHPSLLATGDELFNGVTLSLGHLEEWSGQDGMSWSTRPPDRATGTGGEIAARVFQAPSDEVTLAVGGTLSFDHAIGEMNSTASTHTLWRRVSYRIVDLESVDLDRIVERFVQPLATVTTLCANVQTKPTRLQVAPVAQPGEWMRVFSAVTSKSPKSVGRDLRPLLPFSAVGLTGIGSWVSMAAAVDPLASLLTGTRFSREQTPAVRVFLLAAAAEGLHRRLFDDTPRIEKSLARIVQRGSRRIFARLGEDVLKAISDGLGFLTQPSFGDRLERLAHELATVQPGICGSDEKGWSGKVKIVRNAVAHQLHNNRVKVTNAEQEVLWRSLYWMLTILLLRHAGVSVPALRLALKDNGDFDGFMSLAQSWMPDIYGDTVVSAA